MIHAMICRELEVRTVSLSELPGLAGKGHLDPLRLTDKTFKESDFGGPKHGKLDPTGAPHVGGNTWAGGSGGRDTAGLGGVGGPYRLDSGNPVFQVELYFHPHFQLPVFYSHFTFRFLML